MKKSIFALFAVFVIVSNLLGQEMVILSGKVSNFNESPVDSALVRVLDKNFKEVSITYSDVNGNFAMQVSKGVYNCVYATRKDEYRKSKLEYWAWNVPLLENMELNPKFNNMEIYGVNVFEPQVTPHETYMIYFRPMSLKKILTLVEKQNVDKEVFEKIAKAEDLLKAGTTKLFNVAPDSIKAEELSVKINGVESKVVNNQRVKEFARGMYMFGYLVQVIKPEENKTMNTDYDKVSITLSSEETGEIGLGEAFVKRIN